MTYLLEHINEQAARDPAGFIARAEKHYHRQVEETAASIAACMYQRPVVLLNGPSSSGKTTTARLLCQALNTHGVGAVAISMDDYYRTRSEYSIPVDDEGVYDFESPLCMDLPLLSDHLQRLADGGEIDVPHFDFEKQSRTEEVTSLRLHPDEVAVIEGIHSFSDAVTGGLGDKATCLYLSVSSSVIMSDGTTLEPEMLRFMRRAIRDRNFRGASVEATLRQWRSVRRGERLYIAPYQYHTTQSIDSYLPYEGCILMHMLEREIQGREEELRAVGLHEVYQAIGCFSAIDYQPYLPENSLLHEFIG